VVPVEAETVGLPFCAAVVSVTRRCWETKNLAQDPAGGPTGGTRYYASSLELGAYERLEGEAKARAFKSVCQRAAHLSRGHWGVENKNHWKRDACWGEDAPDKNRGPWPRPWR
jgi:hypothetical protein